MACAIGLAGCASSPESGSPVARKEGDVPAAPTKQLITMGDPNANAYFVKDISAGKDTGGWRWTYDHPELRFIIRKADGVHAVADFSIADATFQKTGPVTIQFFVNDKVIAKEKYTKAGSYHFDQAVPAGLLTVDKPATFALEPKPVWVSPTDKAHLGVILVRAGFAS